MRKPRQARQASGTGIYHVMMRGINHQNIFEEQKAADEERFRKIDEEHQIREAALESRIRELEDARNNNDSQRRCPFRRKQRSFTLTLQI